MKIGIFDSGLGGITVFKEILNQNIKAEFYYLADNKNIPYGIKDKSEVKELIEKNIKYLIDIGCQIIVIACNTATALSINLLRKKYPNIIFIGTEPAVKVAADDKNKTKILVTATSITLKEEKLSNLISNLKIEDEVELLPLDKLVIFAEKNERKDRVKEYIKKELSRFDLNSFSHIVLGCTHFPIFKKEFETIAPNSKIIDGSIGIANNLKEKINKECERDNNTTISLILTNEDDDFVDNYTRLIEYHVNNVKVI